MKKMKIIFRSCVVVETMGPSPRPFGLDKQTITLKCLKSLLESCSPFSKRISIDIVDDSSGKEAIDSMKNLLKRYKIKSKIHSLNVGNNGKSLEYSYGLAEKSREDLIYFCEDDYFHLKEAIRAILDAYDSKVVCTSNFAVFPCDYPREYVNIFPTYIFLGKICHWRGVIHSTGTFVVTKALFRKFKKTFYALAEFNIDGRGGEKETVNKLWERDVPLIAPIKSLAAHLHKTSLPPLVDWKKEIEKLAI
jgi:hypothetical protein